MTIPKMGTRRRRVILAEMRDGLDGVARDVERAIGRPVQMWVDPMPGFDGIRILARVEGRKEPVYEDWTDLHLAGMDSGLKDAILKLVERLKEDA